MVRTRILSREFAVQSQRLPDHLVHVVITIRRKPTYEVDVSPLLGQGAVLRVNSRIRRLRHRIVRVTAALRVFVYDACAGITLAGQMLKFAYTRVIKV